MSRYKNWVQLGALGLLFLWQFAPQATLNVVFWGMVGVAAVLAAGAWLIRKRSWKGANWFVVSFSVVAAVNQFLVPQRYLLLLIFTLGLTWYTAIEYFLGMPKLLKNRFVSSRPIWAKPCMPHRASAWPRRRWIAMCSWW